MCDCFLKDSLTYLDHINGKKHPRYLGYSMRVEKSTTEEVSGVLRGLAEKKQEREGCGSVVHGGGALASEALDFEEVVRMKDNEALQRKAERARRREARKRKEKEERNGSLLLDAVEDKNADHIGAPVGDEPVNDEEEEDEDGGIHPDIAAMMGFSGFGSKK